MKKILLTLFAVAAVFVACDKDNYEDQFEVIAPEVEEISSVESNPELDAAFSFISSLNDSVNSGKVDVSPKSESARAGDFGDNWIQILYFDYTISPRLGERDYAYVRSDNNGVVCADTDEDASTSYADVMLNPSEISYTLVTPHPNPRFAAGGFSQLVIENISSSGVSSMTSNVNTAGWQATFNADFNRIFPAQADRSGIAGGIAAQASRFDTTCAPAATVYEYGTRIIGGAHDGRVIIPSDPLDMDAASNPSAAAVGTDNIQLQVVRREAGFGVLVWENVGDPFTNPNYVAPPSGWTMAMVDGVKTFTNPAMGVYTVTPAPFPLTGMLATVVSEADGVTGTLNYAGTSEAAVINSIQTSFAN